MEKWKKDLRGGRTSKEIMTPFLHTLGNLTVVTQSHNSKVGNKPLSVKQKYPNVEGSSAPLRLHKDWIRAKRWTQVEIKKRSLTLLNSVKKQWPDLNP